MADITHGTWIKDGKAVDAVYQNGVQVYGRNLVLNSDFENSVTNVNTVNSGLVSGSTDYSYQGTKSLKVSISSGTATPDSGTIIRPKNVQPNATYTVTGWLYSDVSRTLNIRAYSSSWHAIALKSVDLKEKTWINFECHFTTEASLFNVGIAVLVNGTTGIDIQPFYIDTVKIERGTITTPYSPAPEDILN